MKRGLTMIKIRTLSLLTGAAIIAIIVLVCGSTYWLLGSERGTHTLLALVQKQLPQLTLTDARGSLLNGLHVADATWRATDTEVHLNDVQLQLRWLHLLHGSITLSPLHIHELRLTLSGTSNDEPVKLPTLFLPVALNAPDVALQQLTIINSHSADSVPFALHDLRAALSWRGTRLHATNLHARWNDLQTDVSGTIDFHGDYPLRLQGALRTPQWPTPIALRTAGDLRQLKINAVTEQPYALSADLQLATLDRHLPLQLQAKLTRPAQQAIPQGTLDIANAVLNARGDLTKIEADLKADVNETHVGATQLALALQWQPEQLQTQLHWQIQRGLLQLDCTAALTKPLSGDCSGAATAIPLTPWLNGQTGEFSSAIKLQGRWLDPQWALALDLPAFNGQLGNDKISGQLALNTRDGEQWQLQRLVLGSGPNKLSGSGEFGTRNQLQFNIDARDLAHLHPQLGGNVNASITLAGEWPEPNLHVNARGTKLRYQNIAISQANTELAIAKLGNAASRVQLEAQRIVIDNAPPVDLTIALSGTRSQQHIDTTTQLRANQLLMQCDAQNAAQYNDWKIVCNKLHGAIRSQRYSSNWDNAAPLRAQMQLSTRQFELSPFCVRADSGELCLDQTLRYSNDKLQPFAAHGRRLPLRWLDAWLPENLALEDDPRASLQLQLQSIAPLRAQADITVDDSRWQWQTATTTQKAQINNVHVHGDLTEQRAILNAGATSPSLGGVNMALTINDPRTQRTLDGHIDLQQLELAGFAWLVDGLDALSGQLNGTVNINGTAAAPQLHGKLFLQNGNASWGPLGAPFRDIHADLTFDNNSAKLGGWFALGQGGGDIDGDVSWEGNGDNWQARVAVIAGGLSAMPLPQSTVVFSPHAELTAKPREAHITGYVDIASADLKLKQLPPNTTDVSQDAEIIGERVDDAWQVWADLGLNLGDKFHFSGFGADVDLSGRLQVAKKPGDNVHVTGEVKVPHGRYRAYGQRLTVRKGSFIFYGPQDNPDLNLEAVRDMPPGVTDVVGLRVIGSLKTPEALLFSEPSMPDSDIAYYLLTGRKPAVGTNTGGYSASGALLSLGLAGSEDKAGQLAQKFGISDLQLGTSEGSNGTEAEVSGQLGQNLSVRYGRSLGQRNNSISFQYRLTPKLMIETISGIEDALDLLYSFEIK